MLLKGIIVWIMLNQGNYNGNWLFSLTYILNGNNLQFKYVKKRVKAHIKNIYNAFETYKYRIILELNHPEINKIFFDHFFIENWQFV